jgi:hypothetical protein
MHRDTVTHVVVSGRHSSAGCTTNSSSSSKYHVTSRTEVHSHARSGEQRRQQVQHGQLALRLYQGGAAGQVVLEHNCSAD